ncbi:hypothetical protein [Nocardia sp. NBC_00416]|uniref:hypothetical protein n=1 Tax=Nocardia sp. NBC_00416 TaxID=2975991 RepID=UPI002E1C2695
MNDSTDGGEPFPEVCDPVSGARWRGRLWDNPGLGWAPRLDWYLRIPGWPDGSSWVNVMIDGIPLDVPSWRALEGAQVECTEFGEPIEATAYVGYHNGFDYVRIHVLRQAGAWARFDIELGGCESDRLELREGEIIETGWLSAIVDAEFEGIEPAADRELTEFTETGGLVFDEDAGLYKPAA